MKAVPRITLPALAMLAAAAAVSPEMAKAQQDSASGSPPATSSPVKSTGGSKAKPPVHKPEQSALNQTGHDERAKKALEESRALLQESLRKEQAAKQEAQRLTKDQLTPATAGDAAKDPEKAVKALKDKITPEKAEALKEQAKKTAKTLLDSDEAKKLIEDTKKKAAAAAVEDSKKARPGNAPPAAATPPLPPTTFDTIPGPSPATPAALPAAPKRAISGLFKGDRIVMPPSMDPKHPAQKIKPEDPVGRTIVLTGNAQIKMPTMQVDADEIVILKAISSSGSGPFDFGSGTPPPASRPAADSAKSADADKSKGDSNGLENMVATGRVRVLRIDKGSEIHAKGNRMVYDAQKGSTTMTGWPSLQQENKVITPEREDAVIVLYSNDKDPYTTGCSVKILSDSKGSAGNNKPAAPAAGSSGDPPAADATKSPPSSSSAPGSGAQRQSPPRRPAGQSR